MLLKQVQIQFETWPVVSKRANREGSTLEIDSASSIRPPREVDVDELFSEFSKCDSGRMKSFVEKY